MLESSQTKRHFVGLCQFARVAYVSMLITTSMGYKAQKSLIFVSWNFCLSLLKDY